MVITHPCNCFMVLHGTACLVHSAQGFLTLKVKSEGFYLEAMLIFSTFHLKEVNNIVLVDTNK